MVRRSLRPLPSRTAISPRAKSTLCTRNRRHPSSRSPAPYNRLAASQTPSISSSSAATSSRLKTTGTRSRGNVRFGRGTPFCAASEALLLLSSPQTIMMTLRHGTHEAHGCNDVVKRTYQGSCHCGRFRFEVVADIDHVCVCDCSICRKRGALNFRVPNEDVRLITPLSELTLYRWGTMTAADYFCPICGILPLRRPRTRHSSESGAANSSASFDGWAVNVRCLDDFDISSVPVKVVYGSRLPLP